jgi:hypothetical protein
MLRHQSLRMRLELLEQDRHEDSAQTTEHVLIVKDTSDPNA